MESTIISPSLISTPRFFHLSRVPSFLNLVALGLRAVGEARAPGSARKDVLDGLTGGVDAVDGVPHVREANGAVQGVQLLGGVACPEGKVRARKGY
jgi:hypothetical protein